MVLSIGKNDLFPKITLDTKLIKKYIKCTSAFCRYYDKGIIKITKCLGKGSYGKVCELQVKGIKIDVPLVVKTTKELNMNMINEIRRQIILSNIVIPGHPLGFVPRIMGAMVCDKQLNIIMESVVGYTLDDVLRVKTPSVAKLKAWVFHVLAALYYYYKAVKFTHYDLHRGNVMLARDERKYIDHNIEGVVYRVPTFGKRIVLIDFGLSRLEYKKEVYSNPLSEFGIRRAAHQEYDLQFFLRDLDSSLNSKEWTKFYTTMSSYFSDVNLNKYRMLGSGSLTSQELIKEMFQEYRHHSEREKPITIVDGSKVVRL